MAWIRALSGKTNDHGRTLRFHSGPRAPGRPHRQAWFSATCNGLLDHTYNVVYEEARAPGYIGGAGMTSGGEASCWPLPTAHARAMRPVQADAVDRPRSPRPPRFPFRGTKVMTVAIKKTGRTAHQWRASTTPGSAHRTKMPCMFWIGWRISAIWAMGTMTIDDCDDWGTPVESCSVSLDPGGYLIYPAMGKTEFRS